MGEDSHRAYCTLLSYEMSRRGKSTQDELSGFWRLEKKNDKWLLVGIDFFLLKCGRIKEVDNCNG